MGILSSPILLSYSVLATVASVFRYSLYTFMRNGDLGAIGSRKTASHRGREALSHSILPFLIEISNTSSPYHRCGVVGGWWKVPSGHYYLGPWLL